jgi:hypothetical protein
MTTLEGGIVLLTRGAPITQSLPHTPPGLSIFRAAAAGDVERLKALLGVPHLKSAASVFHRFSGSYLLQPEALPWNHRKDFAIACRSRWDPLAHSSSFSRAHMRAAGSVPEATLHELRADYSFEPQSGMAADGFGLGHGGRFYVHEHSFAGPQPYPGDTCASLENMCVERRQQLMTATATTASVSSPIHTTTATVTAAAAAALSIAPHVASATAASQGVLLQTNDTQSPVSPVCFVNIHSRNSNGMTALHLAVAHRRQSAVILLMRCGADPTARNAAGRTSFDLATNSKLVLFHYYCIM